MNNKSKEEISLSSYRHADKVYVSIDYFTIGDHWNDFEASLGDFDITYLSEDKFVAAYKKYKENKIELLNDSSSQNNVYKHLRFSFSYKKKGKVNGEEKPIFPLEIKYDFRYSTWYFDIKIESGEKDIYYPEITLTKKKRKNKIEFLDRKNFLISYTDEYNNTQKIRGRYECTRSGIVGTEIYSQTNGPSIEMQLENASVILDKLYFREPVDFSKCSTKNLIEFMFNMYYQIEKNSTEVYTLRNKVYLNRPMYDIKRN